MSKIPSKTKNYTVYRNGTERLGTATVDLPAMEALTTTISGAGIMGEIDMPTPGHFASMTVTLNWRTIDAPMLYLSSPEMQALDLRAVQEVFDTTAGILRNVPIRVSLRCLPKTTTLGSLAPNTTSDGSNELEVLYIKVMVDGITVLEYDKLNYIYKVNGVDYGSEERRQLGML